MNMICKIHGSQVAKEVMDKESGGSYVICPTCDSETKKHGAIDLIKPVQTIFQANGISMRECLLEMLDRFNEEKLNRAVMDCGNLIFTIDRKPSQPQTVTPKG